MIAARCLLLEIDLVSVSLRTEMQVVCCNDTKYAMAKACQPMLFQMTT
jgi:hypothetical protein